MKTVLLTAALFIGSFCFAQDNDAESITFKCKTVSSNPELGIIEYIGNASFKNEMIAITDAGKIVYDIASKEITVSGGYTYTFKGDLQVSATTNNKTFTYKLGDNVAYIR